MTSSWFFLSTLNYDARSTTHQIYKQSYKKNPQLTKVVQNTDINEMANLFSSTRRL
jgi:hypothetical protein